MFKIRQFVLSDTTQNAVIHTLIEKQIRIPIMTIGSDVYVYSGEGANEDCKIHLVKSLQENLTKKHQVSLITPKIIKQGKWPSKAALIVFGGGYDLGFIKALGREGIKIINQYVANGGKYLGICAGGYFGCKYIEFDKDGPLEVCGERHLGFFPGLCKGPVYPGFQYNSIEASIAAPINFSIISSVSISFDSFFYGGGCFILPETNGNLDLICDVHGQNFEAPNGKNEINCFQQNNKLVASVKILGKYSDLPGEPAAIVRTKFGNGTTILSGVHIEYIPSLLLEKEPQLTNLVLTLEQSEAKRLDCFRLLLQELELDTVCVS